MTAAPVPAQGVVRLDRRFATTPERLWQVLTDPELRTRWGAPSDDAVLILTQSDLREGGQDHHRCGPKEAPEFEVWTRWYRLDAPTLACFTETIEAGGMIHATCLVTYMLGTEGAETTLGVDIAVSAFSGEEVIGDVEAGWTSALARLALQLQDATSDA